MVVSLLAWLLLITAIALVFIIVVQDPKGGSTGMFGGGGGNSVFGSTGAPTLLTSMTKWLAITFALLSVGLTWAIRQERGQGSGSVIENAQIPAAPVNAPATAPVAPAAADSAAPTTAPAAAPAATAPAAAAPAAPAKK